MARQIKKMQVREKMAKKRAIEARKSGDISGSKLHIKSSLQYRKWAHSAESFKAKMEGVQYKLEQAKIMGQFSGVAKEIVGTLKNLQSTVKMPEILNMIEKMDFGFGKFEAMMGETTSQLEVGESSSEDTKISDNEVDSALEEIDMDLSAESLSALPSVPSFESPEAEIGSLEDEIKRLKEKH